MAVHGTYTFRVGTKLLPEGVMSHGVWGKHGEMLIGESMCPTHQGIRGHIFPQRHEGHKDEAGSASAFRAGEQLLPD